MTPNTAAIGNYSEYKTFYLCSHVFISVKKLSFQTSKENEPLNFEDLLDKGWYISYFMQKIFKALQSVFKIF